MYKDGNLQFFNHAEGYVEPENDGTFTYIYQYKDHLGNIRLSYADDNNDGSIANDEIRQEKNYYPFGLRHKGYNFDVNGRLHNYGFTGKEEQNELGLEWVDITARNYDPAIARWMNLDPLAEQMRRHSPYNYAFNNPIYFFDPDGMAPQDCCSGIKKAFNDAMDALDRLFLKPMREAKPNLLDNTPTANRPTKNKTGSYFGDLVFNLSGGPTIEKAIDGDPKAQFKVMSNAIVSLVPGSRTSPADEISSTVSSKVDDVIDLGVRAKEIHSALPEATQRRTTTAVAEATDVDGNISYIVGSSEKRLRPAQRAVLNSNETMAVGAGHAEVTAINAAQTNGQKVLRVGASRPICDGCAQAIENAGAQPASALKNPDFRPIPIGDH